MKYVMRLSSLIFLVTGVLGFNNVQANLINPGDIVVGDISTGSIIKVDPNSGAQSVISSGGFLVSPTGIAFDVNGDILVADGEAFGGTCQTNGCGGVIRIDRTTGVQTEVTSGGVFIGPLAIHVASDGDLIIVDDGGAQLGQVVRVDPVSGSQTVISAAGVLVDPQGFVFNQQGNIVIAEGTGGGAGFNGSIVIVDPQTGAQTILSVGGHIVSPLGITIDSMDGLYFTEPGAIKIVYVDPLTGNQTLISSGGFLIEPSGIEFDENEQLVVSDRTQVIRIDPASGTQTVVSMGGNLVRAAGIGIVPGSVVMEVVIDIKPGSDPNSINLGSAGVIPVAILSSWTFDATTVDPETVALAGASVKMVGKSDKFLCSEKDVNGDNLVDLLCKVQTAEFMIETGDSMAVLEAQTWDGVSIRGEDTIRIVPDR